MPNDGQHFFTMIPNEVWIDSRLTKNQLKVLCVLFSFRNKDTSLAWPSKDQIKVRCGLALNKISVTTAQLVHLGWVIKSGDGGRSRSATYKIAVPESLKSSQENAKPVPNQDSFSHVQITTKPVPNWDLNQSRIGTGQRTDHEQIIHKEKVPKRKVFDFSVLPKNLSEDIWKDFVQHRKNLKAPITQTVVNTVGKELAKLEALGISPDEAISLALNLGWRGFRADWIIKHFEQQKESSNGTAKRQGRSGAVIEKLQKIAKGDAPYEPNPYDPFS